VFIGVALNTINITLVAGIRLAGISVFRNEPAGDTFVEEFQQSSIF
jgi:hypothetical protein